MKKFTRLESMVLPLDRANVDTDAIIPKQFLKSIKRTGFGENLFDSWRYLDPGEPGKAQSERQPNPDFVLNDSRYQGSEILLARENFGCGSSREHAVWALDQYGFRCVIATSFADIFFNNSFKSGLLPIALPRETIAQLFDECADTDGYRLTVDLDQQLVTTPGGQSMAFEVDEFRRHCLLQGLDDIDLTLKHAADIEAYEKRQSAQTPWLFGS